MSPLTRSDHIELTNVLHGLDTHDHICQDSQCYSQRKDVKFLNQRRLHFSQGCDPRWTNCRTTKYGPAFSVLQSCIVIWAPTSFFYVDNGALTSLAVAHNTARIIWGDKCNLCSLLLESIKVKKIKTHKLNMCKFNSLFLLRIAERCDRNLRLFHILSRFHHFGAALAPALTILGVFLIHKP